MSVDNTVACSSNSINQPFQFVGPFAGLEGNIRITSDKRVSVFDFITIVGGQKNPYQTWYNILESHSEEILQFLEDYKFGTKKKTPVINVTGIVKLLMWLPGETAKQFRSASARILVSYLGGDLSLIDEIKKIDEMHTENPNNTLNIFRNDDTVQTNLLFTPDQLNISKRLIAYYADKLDMMYGLQFYRDNILIQKVGSVPTRKFIERHTDHKTGKSGLIDRTGEICYNFMFQMKDPSRVESEFKASSFYQLNKIEIPRVTGDGTLTEIFELKQDLTSEMIKQELIKTAGDRIIDPPPKYIEAAASDSLEIEKEKTKQSEEQRKKAEVEYNFKQKELEYKMLQLQFEMKKYELPSVPSASLPNLEAITEVDTTELVPDTVAPVPNAETPIVPYTGSRRVKPWIRTVTTAVEAIEAVEIITELDDTWGDRYINLDPSGFATIKDIKIILREQGLTRTDYEMKKFVTSYIRRNLTIDPNMKVNKVLTGNVEKLKNCWKGITINYN
jgi:hypothetical protein